MAKKFKLTNRHNNCGNIFACEKNDTTLQIMKKERNVSSLLGVNQQDAAMLLGVSRSLWSMYELGRRDISLPVKQLLAELLTYVQSGMKKKKVPNANYRDCV